MNNGASKAPETGNSIITDEVAETICQRIEACGTVSAIDRDPSFPTARTIYRKLETDENFRSRFNFALNVRSERWAEEIVGMSDSIGPGATMEEIAAVKLKIDARKWIVGKLLPKKYGDFAAKGATHIHGDVHNTVIQVTEAERREIQEQRRRLLDGS